MEIFQFLAQLEMEKSMDSILESVCQIKLRPNAFSIKQCAQWCEPTVPFCLDGASIVVVRHPFIQISL